MCAGVGVHGCRVGGYMGMYVYGSVHVWRRETVGACVHKHVYRFVCVCGGLSVAECPYMCRYKGDMVCVGGVNRCEYRLHRYR